MKKITQMFVGVFCALVLTVSAFAADTAVKASTNAPVAVTTVATTDTPSEPWTLSLAGSGFTATKGTATTAMGLTFQVGHYLDLLLPSEVGARQSVNWISRPDENAGSWALNTEIYNDWRIVKWRSLELSAGPHLGVAYGNVPTRWYFGPEAEARLWVKKDVYTFFRAGYDKNISDTRNDQDLMKYTVGVGFKL